MLDNVTELRAIAERMARYIDRRDATAILRSSADEIERLRAALRPLVAIADTYIEEARCREREVCSYIGQEYANPAKMPCDEHVCFVPFGDLRRAAEALGEVQPDA